MRLNVDASESAPRAPWHLWLVGTVGLLWNSIGVFDHLMTQVKNESYMGRFTPEQLENLYNFPIWLVAFWTVAVWGGMLGSGLVLLRRKLAVSVLLASLLAMAVTGVHNFASADGLYASAGTTPGFVLVIFAVAFGLWFYSRAMSERRVLT